MEIVVQKFGGTSVSNPESRENCLHHIQKELKEGHKVVVVISAMGRNGDPYATDTLLSLLGNEKPLLSEKDLDVLLSTGELISASVFSHLLHENGIKNTILTGGQAGIITNEEYNNAKIISLQPQRLLDTLQHHDVVVVPGFQGTTPSGNTTTLGRGGSDTTATAIGAAVNAKFVDIFTDVEGVMTADPRIVEDAQIIDKATYNEICNLAHQGAKVIHPRAVEIAMQENIPIRVRSTFSEHEGTLITNITELNGDEERIVTGITQSSNLVQIRIQKEAYTNVFQQFSEHSISLDFIQTTPSEASFTIPHHMLKQAISILESYDQTYQFTENLAKVSIVGAGIFGIPGVMSKAVQSLYEKEIDIFQSADSHTTIWVLVPESNMKEAICALHHAFFR